MVQEAEERAPKWRGRAQHAQSFLGRGQQRSRIGGLTRFLGRVGPREHGGALCRKGARTPCWAPSNARGGGGGRRGSSACVHAPWRVPEFVCAGALARAHARTRVRVFPIECRCVHNVRAAYRVVLEALSMKGVPASQHLRRHSAEPRSRTEARGLSWV
eukprot:1638311-Pleurochrysis_carterae.AAC.2